MQSGDAFDITFVKCNETKKTGGQFIKGTQCKCTGKANLKNGWVNVLFPDNEYRKAHIKLITHVNGELLV